MTVLIGSIYVRYRHSGNQKVPPAYFWKPRYQGPLLLKPSNCCFILLKTQKYIISYEIIDIGILSQTAYWAMASINCFDIHILYFTDCGFKLLANSLTDLYL